jgi:CRP-like cAMP-binding protein
MGNSSLDRYLKPCPKGTVLFEEGQSGDRMYVIQTGKVQVVKRIGDVRFPLAVLGPGDCVGEMALLDGQPRSADALVTEDSTLLVLERGTFEHLLRDNGEIAVRIMRKLSERLREANRTIEGILAHNGVLLAVRMLRTMASPGQGSRELPADASPETLALRGGLTLEEAKGAWERLRLAGVLQQADGRTRLAPDEIVDDYLGYLDMKQRYDPLTVHELADVTGLAEEEVHRVVQRVLANRIPAGQNELVDTYQQYLTLKRRFEYPDRA